MIGYTGVTGGAWARTDFDSGWVVAYVTLVGAAETDKTLLNVDLNLSQAVI